MNDKAQKMFALSKAMAKAGEQAVTLHPGEPGWTDWLRWRKLNGFGNSYMETQRQWSVPSKYPPNSGLDTALAEYSAGTASKKLAR